MKRLGMWQGFKGIWWAVSDPDLGFSESESQPIDSYGRKARQKRYLREQPRVGGFDEPLQTSERRAA